MPATRLILISHVATAATRRAAFAVGDEPPEVAGLAVARVHRGALPAARETIASPALAARATAEALDLEAAPCPALRDLEAGCWTGRSLDGIAPADVAAWRADPSYDDHGGESLIALIERMADFLASRLTVPGTTIGVTHPAPVRAALVSALGAPAPTFWHIDVPPLAALVLGSDGRRWSLRTLGPIPEALKSGG